jgi:hypothetical protein
LKYYWKCPPFLQPSALARFNRFNYLRSLHESQILRSSLNFGTSFLHFEPAADVGGPVPPKIKQLSCHCHDSAHREIGSHASLAAGGLGVTTDMTVFVNEHTSPERN